MIGALLWGWFALLGHASEPARIAALGVDVEETVVALGLAEQVVAVVDGAEGLDHATSVGMHRRIGTEAVLATRPTKVIAGASVGPAEVLDALEGAGLPVERAPAATDLDGVRATLRAVARAAGVPEGGERLVKKLEADLAKVPEIPEGTRVAFLYARGAGTLMLAGEGTGVHAVIEAAGATPVARWEGYKPITTEALLSLRPDVLLLTTHGLESLGGEPEVRKLDAVRLVGDGLRIVSLDDRLLLSMGPRTGEAALALARALGGAK